MTLLALLGCVSSDPMKQTEVAGEGAVATAIASQPTAEVVLPVAEPKASASASPGSSDSLLLAGLQSPSQPGMGPGSGSTPLPASSAPSGATAIGGPSVSGGAVANASVVVAGMAAGFRRCYKKGLTENPKMKGTLRITANLGPSGEVLSATPSGGEGLSAWVVSCLAGRVAAATFAAPSTGSATVVIPISLFPE